MSRLLDGLIELPRWLWLVAKKLVWLLGLLPTALDIASTYVPGFPQVQVPLEWSIGIGCLGVFASTFLVHLDPRSRLTVYENHEPDYDLQVLEVSSKVCGSAQIHIDCTFRVMCKNPWPGELIRISLDDSKLLRGIAPGLLSHLCYRPIDWHCDNPLSLPYPIPPNGCDFGFTVHYPVSEPLDSQAKKSWERMIVRLCLLIGYETQPVGCLQKSIPLGIPVNLKVLGKFVKSEIGDAK